MATLCCQTDESLTTWSLDYEVSLLQRKKKKKMFADKILIMGINISIGVTFIFTSIKGEFSMKF